MPTSSYGALRVLLLSFFLLPLLHGCLGEGGDSQSRPDSTPDGSVSGQVLDPPIQGAQVRLVDAEGNALSALVRSDDQGRFKLQYRGDTAGARQLPRGGAARGDASRRRPLPRRPRAPSRMDDGGRRTQRRAAQGQYGGAGGGA